MRARSPPPQASSSTPASASAAVLTIARLAPGSEGYYLSTVASGVEDYYVGVGEAPGYWTGEAAAGHELDGEVAADVYVRCWAGICLGKVGCRGSTRQ